MPVLWCLSEPKPFGLDSAVYFSVLLLWTMFFIISTFFSHVFGYFFQCLQKHICICISFTPILIFPLKVSTCLVTWEKKRLTMRISNRRKHKILNIAEWMCQWDTFTRHNRNNWIYFSDSKCVYWAQPVCDPMDSPSLKHNFSCAHQWQRHNTMITLDGRELDPVYSNSTLPMSCKFLICLCMNSQAAAFFQIWILPGDCVCPRLVFISLFTSLQEPRQECLCFLHSNLPLSCFPSNASLEKHPCRKAHFTKTVPFRACPEDGAHLGHISSFCNSPPALS